jgi:integrase
MSDSAIAEAPAEPPAPEAASEFEVAPPEADLPASAEAPADARALPEIEHAVGATRQAVLDHFLDTEGDQSMAQTATRRNKSGRNWNAEQVHDYVLFMANTGLRLDEAKNLQHRDVMIATDESTGERILEIEVRSKRGVGYCKSMPNAVRPYERLRDRAKPVPGNRRKRLRAGEDIAELEKPKYPEPNDPVFPGNHIKLFNGVLKRAKLKFDRDDNPRTAYSLRHTYICMRLMEGADIYQIAKSLSRKYLRSLR